MSNDWKRVKAHRLSFRRIEKHVCSGDWREHILFYWQPVNNSFSKNDK